MSAIPTSLIPPQVMDGITTSWLPVTTAYPYLAGCSSAFFLYPGKPLPNAFDPGYGYFAGGDLSCLPPAMTTWHEQIYQNPDGYTSLSIQPIVCPESWTTAATEIRYTSSTIVMCCPSGYDLNGGQPGRVTGICQSPLSSGQTITYTAQDGLSAWTSTTMFISSATAMNAVAMEGWNVAPSTPSPSLASATLNPSSTPTLTSTPQEPSGISAGSKAVIGIGVIAIVFGLLCPIFIIRRHRKRIQGPPQIPATVPNAPEVGSGPVHEMYQRHPPAYTIQPKQMAVHEMHDRTIHFPVELESC